MAVRLFIQGKSRREELSFSLYPIKKDKTINFLQPLSRDSLKESQFQNLDGHK